MNSTSISEQLQQITPYCDLCDLDEHVFNKDFNDFELQLLLVKTDALLKEIEKEIHERGRREQRISDIE